MDVYKQTTTHTFAIQRIHVPTKTLIFQMQVMLVT